MAFTAAKQFESVMGNMLVGNYKLTGDGSDTTWDAPVDQVLLAIWQRADDTNQDIPITWSGNTITFTTAPASSKYGYMFYMGV